MVQGAAQWAAGLGLYVGGVLLQGYHRGGGPRGVGDRVVVEGRQAVRLGDPLGGHLGGGCNSLHAAGPSVK